MGFSLSIWVDVCKTTKEKWDDFSVIFIYVFYSEARGLGLFTIAGEKWGK